jgi:2-keto-4-pentenoate hydratase/2-oxohepta-3-ene-1,7-dioic acid hydratase in catechol pathway
MRLVTVKSSVGGHPGIIVENEVLDLVLSAEAIPGARLLPSSWVAILAAEDEGQCLIRRIFDLVAGGGPLADRLRESGVLIPEAQARLMAPIPRPTLMLSCGTNYRAHLAEFNATQPSRPGAFIKYSGSVIGTGDAIILPRAYPNLVDYEGEFCFVFGRHCHEVTEAAALDYVLGYTLTNDVSARDWVKDIGSASNGAQANQPVMYNVLGKSFPTFAPLGPTIVTKDEIPDPHAVKFQTVLDGEVMQNGDTSDFIFSIPWLIAEYSKHFHFHPGDVVTTGSPPGVGLVRKPPVLLRNGSRVEVKSEKIGSLINPVVADE